MSTEIIWLHSPDGRSGPWQEPADPRNGPRGFTWMDDVLEREIARSVGRAAHLIGTAHEFRGEAACIAARRGGRAFRVGWRKGDKRH
jgi:hypothetical protein